MDILKIAELSTTDKFDEFSHIGSLYSFEEFAEMCGDGYLIDYDGTADLCYHKQIIKNATISIDDSCITIGDKTFTPESFRKTFDADDFEVIWYNR